MIYLVKNIKTDDTILDICTSYSKALELQEIYKNNFKQWDLLDDVKAIVIEEVELDLTKPILWSYDSSKALNND